MFIAALLIIPKNLDQPRYPSGGEWIKKNPDTSKQWNSI